MPSGRLKVWLIDKGFGFIRPDAGGKDLFFFYETLKAINTISLQAIGCNTRSSPAETGGLSRSG